MKLTLGSLFDGSGGFPLGGMYAGIEPKMLEMDVFMKLMDSWCAESLKSGMLMPSDWVKKNMDQYTEAMTMVIEAASEQAKKGE